MTHNQFKERIKELLEHRIAAIQSRCWSLFLSGGVDAPSYGDDYALPKAVLYVALRDAAEEIRPLSDDLKEVAENLAHF